MEANFWHQRWQDNEIGFHESAVSPRLKQYSRQLGWAKASRIFIPLCGKTLDIGWLAANEYSVVGIELSELAVKQLFNELKLAPEITRVGKLKRYRANNIEIFVGDFFDLTRQLLGPVNAIFDRGALVALPLAMRERYSAHLQQISDRAKQLLICIEYDQALMAGPPFAISQKEVHEHYQTNYHLALIESTDLPGKLKGVCTARIDVWSLT